MATYHYKDKVSLEYDANKERLRAEGRIILREVMNEAISEMTKQFNTALNEGRILSIGGTREEMKSLLLVAANRQLGSGDTVNAS